MKSEDMIFGNMLCESMLLHNINELNDLLLSIEFTLVRIPKKSLMDGFEISKLYDFLKKQSDLATEELIPDIKNENIFLGNILRVPLKTHL